MSSNTMPTNAISRALSTVTISDSFDGGNIKFISQQGSTVTLEIKPDPFTQLEKKTHLQYFCFRALCSNNDELTYVIRNAGDASFPCAWTGSSIFYAPTLNDPYAWRVSFDNVSRWSTVPGLIPRVVSFHTFHHIPTTDIWT